MKYVEGLKVLRFNEKTGKWYKDKPNKRNPWQTTVYILSNKPCLGCGEKFFYCSENKGNCCSLSCNTKYRNSIYGMSKETARKIGDANRGKKRTPEVRERMKYRPQCQLWKGQGNPAYDTILKEKRRLTVISNGTYKGKNNPNWKGGYPERGSYPSKFFKIRTEILERDNRRCQNPECKGISKKIEVHHIDYNRLNNSRFNLISLCRSCNILANYHRMRYKKIYVEIISEIYKLAKRK